MTDDKIYVGDIGTEILVFVGSDIQTGTSLDLIVKKPDGSESIWIGTLSGTESIVYVTEEGDLDQAGTYAIQAKVTMPSGIWSGETAYITVYGEYE